MDFVRRPGTIRATDVRRDISVMRSDLGQLPGVLPVLEPETCNDCGLCCEGIGSPVLMYQSYRGVGPHPVRPPGLPAYLIAEIDEHFLGLSRGQEPQERCLWYDPARRMCRHYEWRPQICRDYELGGRACLERRLPFVRGEAEGPAPGA